jgi:hypothetical protein
MTKPTIWCKRELIQMHCYLALCTSETMFFAELRKLKIPERKRPPYLGERSNATVHFLTTPEGTDCTVVCLGDTAKRSPIEVAGILVHEAVHVFQRYCEHIGEESPSSEFEAYSIQWVSQSLMEAYVSQTNKASR